MSFQILQDFFKKLSTFETSLFKTSLKEYFGIVNAQLSLVGTPTLLCQFARAASSSSFSPMVGKRVFKPFP